MAAKVTGGDKIAANLKEIARAFPLLIGQALYTEAQIEMTKSKKLCPVSPTKAQFRAMGRSMPKGLRPGTLRASGYVAEPKNVNGKWSVEVGYGGAASAYARVQHERLDFRHTTGQAKYLEVVLNASAGNMASRVGARLAFK